MEIKQWRRLTGQCISLFLFLVVLCIGFSFDVFRQNTNTAMADADKEQEPAVPDITPPVSTAEPTETKEIADLQGDYIQIQKQTAEGGKLYLSNDYVDKTLVLEVKGAQSGQVDLNGISRTYHGTLRSGKVQKKDAGDLFRKMEVTAKQEAGKKTYTVQYCWVLRTVTEAALYETEDAYYVTLQDPRKLYDKIIVLDAGHGGDDEGTSSVDGRHEEKDYTSAIVELLRQLFEQDGRVKVYYTRLQDKEVTKKKRVELANSLQADLLVSVHCNASDYGDTSAQGIECLYSQRKTGSLSNKKLAKLLLQNVVKQTGRKKRGLVAREGLYLMHHAKVPASIVEVGYMTNASDMKYMSKERGRKKIAQGIYDAVLEALQLEQ